MSVLSNKISGRTKEILGKATGNRRLETKGKIQRGMAEMEQKATDILDE